MQGPLVTLKCIHGVFLDKSREAEGMTCRRVLVTGLGLVTPLGVGVEQSWTRLVAGESGIGSTAKLGPAYASLSSQVAAWISQGELATLIEQVLESFFQLRWNRAEA